MKTTLKLSTLLVALASVFTFSSCLDDNNSSSNGANYYSAVTITGDDLFGYTFYADLGATLIPTSASVQEILPGLSQSGAKRAYIAFDLASETENGKELVAGQTYNIIVREHYYGNYNYAIPTYNTIMSVEATDSLHTKNERINDVNDYIWAANGYVNAQLTLNYQQNTPFYLNTYYTQEDIDAANNTLNLNLYYNSNSEYQNNQGQSIFSFKLPEEVAYHFSTDSINLVLNAITGYDDSQLSKAAECKVALKDFYVPRY